MRERPLPVILGFPREYPPDDTERRLPDVAAARALLGVRSAPFDALFSQLRRVLAPLLRDDADRALLDRTQAAATLGYARLALRHGRLGRDFHPYHNEAHILDLCGSRLDRLLQTIGPGRLPAAESVVLPLSFARR